VRMLDPTEENLRLAADALREGKLVALPTETVYGLGADAFNPRALARVFEAKNRPHFDPLIVHVATVEAVDRVADLEALGSSGASRARALMEAFWPGPLTLILPKRPEVPDLATSALPSVAVRLPAHPVARRLIELSTGAVAAPSANPFGYLSPTRAAHVADQLGERVDFIMDGGRCPVGVESTVLDLTVDPPLVLRPGGLSVDRLEALLGTVEVFDRSTTSPKAPGQLPSHYAPRARLKLVPAGALPLCDPSPGAVALCFDAASEARLRAEAPGLFARAFVLSPSGDLVEAAAELFETLHSLDASGVAEIWAERVPDAGLGRAVNDRLYKASEK